MKPLRGQALLPIFDRPAGRDATLLQIAMRILVTSRTPQTTRQVLGSTSWVGMLPPVQFHEVKDALQRLTAEGVVRRNLDESRFYVYSVPSAKGGGR